jgi:hypothetical protein
VLSRITVKLLLILTAGLMTLFPALTAGPELNSAGDPEPQMADMTNDPWFIDDIDVGTNAGADDVGAHVSLARNPNNGALVISYYDATNGNLKLAHQDGVRGAPCGSSDTWSCETADSVGNVGQYSSLALHPTTGHPRIAYYDASNGTLKYAEYACALGFCAWSIGTIDGEQSFTWAGEYTSLKVGSDSVPHIAYHSRGFSGGQLRYATRVGASGNCGPSSHWQCDIIDNSSANTGLYPSLDLTSASSPYNVPYIAYYDAVGGNLRWAWYLAPGAGTCGPGNSWGCTKIDVGVVGTDVGRYPVLRLVKESTPDDHTGIAYYDAGFDRIMYAYPRTDGECSGIVGSWQCDVLTSNELTPEDDTLIAMDLVMDSAYRPHIVYGCRSCYGPSLNIARYVGAFGNCGPEVELFGVPVNTWQCEVTITDATTVHNFSQYAGVDMNSADMMTIAYYDATSGDLMLAQQRTSVFLPLVLR